MINIPKFTDEGLPPCTLVEDPDIFLPDSGDAEFPRKISLAKEVCKSGCPYMAECLQWAVDNREPGVWGGTTPHERARKPRSNGN